MKLRMHILAFALTILITLIPKDTLRADAIQAFNHAYELGEYHSALWLSEPVMASDTLNTNFEFNDVFRFMSQVAVVYDHTGYRERTRQIFELYSRDDFVSTVTVDSIIKEFYINSANFFFDQNDTSRARSQLAEARKLMAGSTSADPFWYSFQLAYASLSLPTKHAKSEVSKICRSLAASTSKTYDGSFLKINDILRCLHLIPKINSLNLYREMIHAAREELDDGFNGYNRACGLLLFRFGFLLASGRVAEAEEMRAASFRSHDSHICRYYQLSAYWMVNDSRYDDVLMRELNKALLDLSQEIFGVESTIKEAFK